MNKYIKQLKALLSIKDARQIRKDGAKLIAEWEEEESKADNRVFHKVKGKFKPLGHFCKDNWLTDGVWIVRSGGNGISNGDYYANEFGIVRVGDNKPADYSTLASQLDLRDKIVRLLQPEPTKANDGRLYYPSRQEIATSIIRMLNSEKRNENKI